METNIDYKALYEEARERAKQVKLADTKENVAAAEYIFPDLKESEDEKMRKRAIAILKQQRGYWSYDGPMDKFPPSTPRKDLVEAIDIALSYLERQKDLFESGRGLYYYDGEKTTYCGYPATEKNPYDFAMSQQEKQKEQNPVEYPMTPNECYKPVEKQDYSGLTDFERAIHRGFLCAGVENVPVTIIKETAQECMAKIKPIEWGRWEEDAFRSIFTDIKTSRKITVNSLHGDAKVREQEQMNKILDFLNRLKAQVKPAEWSEEDEKMFWSVINGLRSGIYDEEKEWLANRLKYLRPQPKQEWNEKDKLNTCPHYSDGYGCDISPMKECESCALRPSWKPSEEQMKALRGAIVFMMQKRIADDEVLPLQSLYNDLLKQK